MTRTRTRRAPQRSRADLAAAFAARLSTVPATGPDECEHGIPMDAPCAPCAIAGHEPVDVEDDEDHDPETCPEGSECLTCVERGDVADPDAYEPDVPLAVVARMAAEPAHLADCRACALLQPMPHEYASLIDQKLTADELRALAAHPDADDAVRQVAAAAVAELTADADLAGVRAYDAAMAAGLGRHVAREHAAVAASEVEGADWNDAAPEVRIAYRRRFSSRPAHAVDGPAPLLGGRIYAEHGTTA